MDNFNFFILIYTKNPYESIDLSFFFTTSYSVVFVGLLFFFKKLIKLQEEANVLLRKLLENKNSTDNRSNNPMPSEDLEKLKTSYMAKMKKYD